MTLRKEDLRKVRNFLIDVSLKWYDLGVELDVEEEALDEIKSVNSNQPRACLREMLRVRLKNADNPLTWKMLADALKSKVIHEVELGRKAEAKVSASLSPDPVLSSRVLDLSTTHASELVNQNIQLDLRHLLRINHDKIITRYAQFVSRLCDSIHDKKVGATNLRTFILRLPAIEGAAGNESTKEKLLKASTINEIIDLIGNECASFIHYDIYQSILEKYCGDIDHDELKYAEHLKSYVNSLKVSEFLEINPQLKKLADATNTIVAKVDIVISSKFSKITDLQTTLASILDVWPSNLKLVSIEEGCVIATFAAQSEIIDIKKLKESSEELQSLSVLWLKCGNYKIDLREKSLTRHRMRKLSTGKAGTQSTSSHYDPLPPSSSHQPAAPTALVRRKSSKTKYEPRSPTPTYTSSYDNTDSVPGRYQDQRLQSLREGPKDAMKQVGKPRVGVTRASSLRLSRDLGSVSDKFSTLPRQSRLASRSEGTARYYSKIGRGGSTVSDYNRRLVKYGFRSIELKRNDRIESPPTLSSGPAQLTKGLNVSDRLSPMASSSCRYRVSADGAKFKSSTHQIAKAVSPPKNSSLDDVAHPTLQTLTQLIWTDGNTMKHKLEIARRVCMKYATIGILLGMDRVQIESHMKVSRGNSYQCCIRIFTKWIENDGHPPKYLKTWTGLCQLLYAINETRVEHELTEALSRFGVSVNASSW